MSIDLLDVAAMEAARAHLDRLTKPPGSLGRLEELVVLVAGITGRPDPRVDRPQIVVAAADHGIARHGVSAYPSPVTPRMVENFLAGGAAINALARAAGADVTVVDVGVAGSIEPRPGRHAARLVQARIADGTADMTRGPAMTADQAQTAIAVGRSVAADLIAGGADAIGVGEMGIGNTSAASAVVAVLAAAPVDAVTGRGTGIDAATRRRKVAAIEQAIAVNRPDGADPIGTLAAVGGLEIATLVGVIGAAVNARVPVVLDGFITGAAALAAASLEPAIAPRLIASHRSVEPGHSLVLERLGLRPFLDLELRLGEGTGAALAIALLRSAISVRDEIATFEAAAVPDHR